MFGLSVISGCLFGSGLLGLLCLVTDLMFCIMGLLFAACLLCGYFAFGGCLVRLCSCEF